MSTIFHEGRKVLRERVGNPNYAEIADFLYFREQISNYYDGNKKRFYLLKNIDYLSDEVGFGHTLIKKALKKLEDLCFIKKIRHKCFDGAVRLKIYITSRFKKIMSEIDLLKTSVISVPGYKEPKFKTDQTQKHLSDQTQKHNSYIKEEDSKSNNINTITVPNDLEKKRSLVDLDALPIFTDDNTQLNTLQDLTNKQMHAISECANHFNIDGSQLFSDIAESIDTSFEYTNFNQLLGICSNRQIQTFNQTLVNDYLKKNRKYDIDYYAIDSAKDERGDQLDKSQAYAIEQGLLYLQKRKGVKFDFNELKEWVSISLLNGYKQSGFRKAIRSILKCIEKGKFTKPWSLKYQSM